jgi:hypothetical protein
MMDHQKNELEELDRLYKDEVENKTKEFVEMMQRNSKLTEEVEELKMQAELEKAKQAELPVGKRKGKMPRRWKAEQIAEEDESE